MSRLAYLLSLSPWESWRLLRRRLPGLRRGPAWTATEVLSSDKHRRGIRFVELLLRQQVLVARQMPWVPLSFEGSRVVEIGCGPLGGFGPLALFCGAASFESAEPEWDVALLRNAAVVETYLRVLHADLVALYGPRLSFSAFLEALDDRMAIHTNGFAEAPIHGPVDIVLSQSVLEHVFPLESAVAKLAAISGPGTQCLHLVDFGNHYPTADPFEGLYNQLPEIYIRRRGQAINLLRAPDIQSLFRGVGLNVQLIPARVLCTQSSSIILPWWREQYNDQALFTQLALVAGPAPGT